MQWGMREPVGKELANTELVEALKHLIEASRALPNNRKDRVTRRVGWDMWLGAHFLARAVKRLRREAARNRQPDRQRAHVA